jgi:hypothetical protein
VPAVEEVMATGKTVYVIFFTDAQSCTMGRFKIGPATRLQHVPWNQWPTTSLRWSSSLLR